MFASDGAWTIEDLAERVYSGVNRVEKKHRVSVLRAAKKIVDHDSYWELWSGRGLGGTLILVNCGNVHSYGLGRLKSGGLEGYRSRDLRKPDHWISTEEGLSATLEPGGSNHRLIVPGGSWWRHTQMHIARRDGDVERLAALEEEQDRVMADHFAKIGIGPA